MNKMPTGLVYQVGLLFMDRHDQGLIFGCPRNDLTIVKWVWSMILEKPISPYRKCNASLPLSLLTAFSTSMMVIKAVLTGKKY